eukprot:CAMPEP_0179214072 /NCGR_PEP_ID=MMETSP0797-20121207/2077_1 /TAXON_ID=47934 /ORGANISM="Dinophysis acuminata, Strain DAEP01" /LENGTH=99 /DNA_ID=CAMNT_0020919993 /DNA_START=91 /DNA_END=390 /DNA_ORIENTATION=-
MRAQVCLRVWKIHRQHCSTVHKLIVLWGSEIWKVQDIYPHLRIMSVMQRTAPTSMCSNVPTGQPVGKDAPERKMALEGSAWASQRPTYLSTSRASATAD